MKIDAKFYWVRKSRQPFGLDELTDHSALPSYPSLLRLTKLTYPQRNREKASSTLILRC